MNVHRKWKAAESSLLVIEHHGEFETILMQQEDSMPHQWVHDLPWVANPTSIGKREALPRFVRRVRACKTEVAQPFSPQPVPSDKSHLL